MLLEQARLVDEHELGKPARGDLVELKGALIDLLIDAHVRWIESLSMVAPAELENPAELKGLRLVIDRIEVAQLEPCVNHHRAVPRWRAKDKLLWATLRPDGRQLAAVGREQVVTLYDLSPNPAEPRRLVGHEQTVYRAIYSPDGRQLATVSWDMSVRLWDLETHKELFALRLPTEFNRSPLWDFDFRCTDPGECWIAVPLTMGRLALYRLPYDHPPKSLTNP